MRNNSIAVCLNCQSWTVPETPQIEITALGEKNIEKCPLKGQVSTCWWKMELELDLYTYQGQFSLTDLTPLSGTGN